MMARIQALGMAVHGRLERCDIALAAGTLTMLVGPNGAGKTTLLRALAGVGAAEGVVTIDGEPLAGLPPARRIALLAYLGASRDVLWPLSARDYVALGLLHDQGDGRATAALASVEAEQFAGRRIDTLSTGERTRVQLARALAPGALALLLDEPCANLDPQWQLAVVERLCAEARKGAAVILSVHDLDLAQAHADRVIVIDKGRIVADGGPKKALSPAVVGRIFGVERSAQGGWQRLNPRADPRSSR